MPQNILRNTPEKKIEKFERKIEGAIEQIVENGYRSSWRNLPKRQIEFIK